MTARRSSDYVQNLRDDRRVYYRGQYIDDVTTHPVLSKSVFHAASEYDAQFDNPDVFLNDSGSSKYFEPLIDTASLCQRRELIRESTRQSEGIFNCIRAIGTDAIHSLMATAPTIDEVSGTNYAERIRAYLDIARKNDWGIAVAMTDAKGDRSLAPHEQSDPDVYVRVVDRTDKGIVIRGVKAHTSHGPVSNELLILPSRGMSESDAGYAVACAIPSNAEGVSFICRPSWDGDRSALGSPITARRDEIEALTVFDDVFVPHDRVFLNGETDFAADVVSAFATYHRFTAVIYKPELVDLFVGLAELLAESHGLADESSFRESVIAMIEYVETARGLSIAAAAEPLRMNGYALPNPMYCNVGKHRFADTYHNMGKRLQDIAGGFAVTLPADDDLIHPEQGELVERALAGASDWSGRDRFKLFALVRDLTVGPFGGWQEVLSLHGEGSLAAQRLSMYSLYNREEAKRRVADILDLHKE